MGFSKAKWIWIDKEAENDEYGEFFDQFVFDGSKTVLKISADSNYACYINGKLAACGQYNDFPHYKVHDEIDITDFCGSGINKFAVIVWYYGIENSITYYRGNASLIYQIESKNGILAFSDENTLSRMSLAYKNHTEKYITTQMGLSFCYNSVKEDDWMRSPECGFAESRIVENSPQTYIRPCRIPALSEKAESEVVAKGDGYIIFDLKREVVGLLYLKLYSDTEQEITVCFAERLTGGRVKNIIDERDFSVGYTASKGKNEYMNPFRRIGCRYLEIRFSEPITVEYLTLIPRIYRSDKRNSANLNLDDRRKRLYDISVNTLELCRNEHYEDCPWREQGLYALDSRNQMLFGYYVFEGYEFARASLVLLGKDNRKDDMLSMTAPSSLDLCIPSFALHYVIAVAVYYYNILLS